MSERSAIGKLTSGLLVTRSTIGVLVTSTSAFPNRDSSMAGRLRHEFDLLLGRVFHGFPAVEQREVLSSAPQRRQITIVRTVRISGLTGIIHCSRVVPVSHVDHEASRGPACLAEILRAIRGGIYRVTISVLGNGADINSGACRFVDEGGKGMFRKLKWSFPHFHWLSSAP